jgi:L-ascorbate metabolism protein UlaG (beta-lactamase superfamily)
LEVAERRDSKQPLIHPMKDAALRGQLPAGVIRFHWLGQSGFVIETSGVAALLDPWFSPHQLRLHPAPNPGELPDSVEWLFVTHEHADHLDLPAIPALLARYPRIHIVVPTPLMGRVRDVAPQATITGVQPGDDVTVEGLRVHVVPAWHGVTVADGYTEGPPGKPAPYVGYVLTIGTVSIYHAGDTIAAQSLIETLRTLAVDVALLPINGRDFFRESAGILGNLDAREAVRLASVIGAQFLIPMHHDMVRGNTARAGEVVDAVDELGLPIQVIVPNRHRPVELYFGGSR